MTEAPTDRRHRLADGRLLGFAEYGAADGTPLFYCHGLPASRLEGRLFEAAAIRNRVRVIVIDRPGFGLSDPRAPFRVADWPDDLATLADALVIPRFSVLGVSAGGPYALACAWKLPARVRSVGIVGALGPVFDADALAEMRRTSRISFSLAHRAPWLLRLIYNRLVVSVLRQRPQLLYSMLGSGVCPADRRLFERTAIRDKLFASWREALRQGAAGALAELERFVAPWGFSPSALTIPVHLWHGESDSVVPVAHGHRYARSIGTVNARFVPDEGHFSLPIERADAIIQAVIT